MENKGKKEVQKYMAMYMSLGMCFGVSGGLIFGLLLFPENMALGMCFGIPIGTGIGMIIGSARDKKLEEKMMEITRIEAVPDSTDKVIYAVDKNGTEKGFKVTERKMKEECFAVGDRVAEESKGYLVSLESK